MITLVKTIIYMQMITYKTTSKTTATIFANSRPIGTLEDEGDKYFLEVMGEYALPSKGINIKMLIKAMLGGKVAKDLRAYTEFKILA